MERELADGKPSMKFLLINYRYFVSGGPEKYLFNLKDLLESENHEVIPFSVAYEQNVSSKFSSYFAPPLSATNEVYFKDHSWTPKSFMRTWERLFYSEEVYRALVKLIRDCQPDFAIVLHYMRKLSPSVLVALNSMNIPFMVRLSDFAMICPDAHLLRNQKPCELCVKGSLLNSLRYRCVQGSYVASAGNILATKYHYQKGFFDLIDCFVTPSRFLKQKMIEGGWEPSKIHYLPTFEKVASSTINNKRKRQILFVGRIDSIKGIDILLKSVRHIQKHTSTESFKTLLVGKGNDEYSSLLKRFVADEQLKDVSFLGDLPSAKVLELFRESLLSVVPSITYENVPNVVIESLGQGTPVLASNLGSIPEVVLDGKTGLLFEPGSDKDLSSKILNILNSPHQWEKMSKAGIKFVNDNHSPLEHYKRIINLCYSLMSAP